MLAISLSLAQFMIISFLFLFVILSQLFMISFFLFSDNLCHSSSVLFHLK